MSMTPKMNLSLFDTYVISPNNIVAMHDMTQYVAVCCSELQCVAVCCSVSPKNVVAMHDTTHFPAGGGLDVAVVCSELQ